MQPESMHPSKEGFLSEEGRRTVAADRRKFIIRPSSLDPSDCCSSSSVPRLRFPPTSPGNKLGAHKGGASAKKDVQRQCTSMSSHLKWTDSTLGDPPTRLSSAFPPLSSISFQPIETRSACLSLLSPPSVRRTLSLSSPQRRPSINPSCHGSTAAGIRWTWWDSQLGHMRYALQNGKDGRKRSCLFERTSVKHLAKAGT